MWSADSSSVGAAPWSTDGELFGYVQDLIALRKELAPLRRGATSMRYSTASPRGERDSGIVAFERAADGDTALIVINTADDQASVTCAPIGDGGACMTTSFPAGTALVDVAPGGDGAIFTVGGGGSLEVSVPA